MNTATMSSALPAASALPASPQAGGASVPPRKSASRVPAGAPPPFREITPYQIHHQKVSDSEKHVLLLINALDSGDEPNADGRFACYAANARLADELNIKVPALRGRLDRLRKRGYIVEVGIDRTRLSMRRVVLVDPVVERLPRFVTEWKDGKTITRTRRPDEHTQEALEAERRAFENEKLRAQGGCTSNAQGGCSTNAHHSMRYDQVRKETPLPPSRKGDDVSFFSGTADQVVASPDGLVGPPETKVPSPGDQDSSDGLDGSPSTQLLPPGDLDASAPADAVAVGDENDDPNTADDVPTPTPSLRPSRRIARQQADLEVFRNLPSDVLCLLEQHFPDLLQSITPPEASMFLDRWRDDRITPEKLIVVMDWLKVHRSEEPVPMEGTPKYPESFRHLLVKFHIYLDHCAQQAAYALGRKVKGMLDRSDLSSMETAQEFFPAYTSLLRLPDEILTRVVEPENILWVKAAVIVQRGCPVPERLWAPVLCQLAFRPEAQTCLAGLKINLHAALGITPGHLKDVRRADKGTLQKVMEELNTTTPDHTALERLEGEVIGVNRNLYRDLIPPLQGPSLPLQRASRDGLSLDEAVAAAPP